MLLRQVRYSAPPDISSYPFNLAWLKYFHQLDFKAPITLIVGENGTGKSTLLEGIATNYDAILMSGKSIADNNEFDTSRQFAAHLKLIWQLKTKSGFFFRADDFISFVRADKKRKVFAMNELARIDAEGGNAYEREPYLNTIAALDRLYHTDLDKLSHGQAFLELFKHRLRSGGLYILDEPEAPLTPQNQLALLTLIVDAAKEGHSLSFQLIHLF